ncbi:hypothetical protein Goshw_026427, partial [Gossypium schwendimanii]|nr:hypothetical protein [Gossypium schwendimanii]
MFGFQKVQNLGMYLEVPLFHEKVTNSTFRFMVDKVHSKLHNWDARQLSFAVRVTIARLNAWMTIYLGGLIGKKEVSLGELGFCLSTTIIWRMKEIMPASILRSKCSFLWKALSKFPIVGQDNITIPTRKTHSENKRCPSITTYQAGDWILGYNHYLGECSMFEAELWGILDGYVPKKDNRVVDGIAKLTFDNKEGVLIFEE